MKGAASLPPFAFLVRFRFLLSSLHVIFPYDLCFYLPQYSVDMRTLEIVSWSSHSLQQLPLSSRIEQIARLILPVLKWKSFSSEEKLQRNFHINNTEWISELSQNVSQLFIRRWYCKSKWNRFNPIRKGETLIRNILPNSNLNCTNSNNHTFRNNIS